MARKRRPVATKPENVKSEPAPLVGNNGKKGRGGRRSMNWEKEPYGVFVGSSPTAKASFGRQDAAVKYITTLPVIEQERAFIGQLRKVKVKTEVTL